MCVGIYVYKYIYATLVAVTCLRENCAVCPQLFAQYVFARSHSPNICMTFLIRRIHFRLIVGELIWIWANNINSPDCGQMQNLFAFVVCGSPDLPSHLPKPWGVNC